MPLNSDIQTDMRASRKRPFVDPGRNGANWDFSADRQRQRECLAKPRPVTWISPQAPAALAGP